MSICAEIQASFRVTLDKSHPDSKKNRSLVGSMLLMFVFGSMSTWGTLNVYFFSFYEGLTKEQLFVVGNLLFVACSLPMAIISVFSIRIADKIGIKRLVYIVSFQFPAGVISAGFTKSFYFFVLCYCLVALLAVCIITVPVTKEMWKLFPERKGKIGGMLFGCFGLSSIIFGPLGTLIVNPENKEAIYSIDLGGNKVNFFSEDVASNVPKMLFILGSIYFILAMTGAQLFSNKNECDSALSNESKLESNKDNQLNTSGPEREREDTLLVPENPNECPTLKDGLKTRTFAILFVSSFFTALFVIFFNINFKIYGFSKIKNDHFITVLFFLNGISSVFGRFSMGVLLDYVTFKSLYLTLQLLLSCMVMTLPVAANLHWFTFGLWICAISFLDGGAFSIIGPGFCQIFGMKVGPELLPAKSTSFYLALVMGPLLSFSLIKTYSADSVIFVLGLLNSFGFCLVIFMKEKYVWKQYDQPKQQELVSRF